MTRLLVLRALCVTAQGLATISVTSAQPTTIDWSGLDGIDNAYTVSPDDPDLEGANSFDHHRIYLTGGVDVPTTCE